MTAEAHKYGIRVIVDAVINHFSSDWNAIEPSWQNASLFHTKSEADAEITAPQSITAIVGR